MIQEEQPVSAEGSEFAEVLRAAAQPVSNPSIPEKAPIATENPVNIAEALENSGLVMVETSAAQVPSPLSESQLIAVAPQPRRRRPAVVVVEAEPLVMVETKHSN